MIYSYMHTVLHIHQKEIFSDLFDFSEGIFYKLEVFFEAVVHIEAKGGADYGTGDAAN